MKKLLTEWRKYLKERTILPVAAAAESAADESFLIKSPKLKKDSTDWEYFDPDFAKKVQKIREELRSLGYKTRIVTAYRTPASQLEKFKQGKSKVKFGKHNMVRQQKKEIVPAALAADIIWNNGKHGGYKLTPRNIKYYKLLGKLAKKEGLKWGGNFSQSSPALAKYGIGWDPTHIETSTSLRSLAKSYAALVKRAGTLGVPLSKTSQDRHA